MLSSVIPPTNAAKITNLDTKIKQIEEMIVSCKTRVNNERSLMPLLFSEIETVCRDLKQKIAPLLQVNPILHAWYIDQIKESDEKYRKQLFKLNDDIQSAFRRLETTELLLDSYKQFPRESKDSFILSLSLGEAELNIKKTLEVVETLNKNLLSIHVEAEKFKASWKEAVKIRVDQVENALKKPNERIKSVVQVPHDHIQNLTGMAALQNEVDLLRKVVHQLNEQVHKLTSQQHNNNVQSVESGSSIHMFSKK